MILLPMLLGIRAARRTAVTAAQTDGHPIATIARAAGVTRETIYQWLREEPSGENQS